MKQQQKKATIESREILIIYTSGCLDYFLVTNGLQGNVTGIFLSRFCPEAKGFLLSHGLPVF